MMEVEEEDRISALPDSLILTILLRLPYTHTQRAIATAPLSKRWLRFWTDLYNLHYQNPNTSIFPSNIYGFESVAETLIQCRQFNLAKFQLEGFYNTRFQSHVTTWIRYAVNSNVRELNLTFRYVHNEAKFVLDTFFFINSCYTHLKLYGCVFNPTGAISWKNLKSLCLSYTKLDEDLIENILCGCPVLETFKLDSCSGYRRLDITSKNVKNLIFSGYMDLESKNYADIIEIDAPNISSLTICGDLLLWKLLLLSVSSLVKVNLNYNQIKYGGRKRKHEEMEEEMFKEFILNLYHVHELKIGSSCFEIFSRLEASSFNFPPNIKVLDSPEVAYSSDWSDGDSVKRRDWEYFHMRERNGSFVASSGIIVKLLRNRKQVEDRISALPDGLLIEILCYLPETKYAIRTGTLSKRWKHVWTYIPTLSFRRGYANDSTSNFFSCVNKTLSQCRQLKLSKFELHGCRGYNIQFQSQVDRLIQYAINCNVEQLNFDLLTEDVEVDYILCKSFYINPCITDLSITGCIFIPPDVISWKMLRSLYISHGIIEEGEIEKILLGSPVLETLELHCCYGYTLLDITSKSVKNLIFSGYRNFNDQSDLDDIIEINAPNILSLTIRGELCLEKVLLLNVFSLVNAELNYRKEWSNMLNDDTEEEMLKELILNLQHVKELKIGIVCFTVFFRLEATGFTFPSNLKVLDSLEWVADWLEWPEEYYIDSDTVVNGEWKVLEVIKGL